MTGENSRGNQLPIVGVLKAIEGRIHSLKKERKRHSDAAKEAAKPSRIGWRAAILGDGSDEMGATFQELYANAAHRKISRLEKLARFARTLHGAGNSSMEISLEDFNEISGHY